LSAAVLINHMGFSIACLFDSGMVVVPGYFFTLH